MHFIALMLDGVPSNAQLVSHWLRVLLIPLCVILLSRAIFLRGARPFPALAIMCVVAAAVVLRPAYDLINWGYPFFPPWWFTAAAWLGAALPAIVVPVLALSTANSHSTTGGSPEKNRNRRWLWIPRVASLTGLAWLYFEYQWIYVSAESKFIVYWSLAVTLFCSATILAIRRLTKRDRKKAQPV